MLYSSMNYENQVSNSTLESNCENMCDPLAIHLLAFPCITLQGFGFPEKHVGNYPQWNWGRTDMAVKTPRHVHHTCLVVQST